MDTYEGLPRAAKQFLTYRIAVQGQSRLTASEYACDLRMFFRFIKRMESPRLRNLALDDIDVSEMTLDDIRSITREQIYEFLLYLSEERGNEASARARRLSAVKSFFKHLAHKERVIETDPSDNIDSPALKKALPRYLSLDESVALLQSVENGPDELRTRDFAIVTLFLNCGMRLSELIGMDIGDISADGKSIRILGKRNKERFIYLNDAAQNALAEYLDERRKIAAVDGAVFLSRRRTRINKSTVQKMITRYLSLAGLGEKHYSAHKLRHTSATLMYQSGTDVRVLQEILGHENLNTTQIYTHTRSEQLQKAVRSNPLSDYKKIKKTEQSDEE